MTVHILMEETDGQLVLGVFKDKEEAWRWFSRLATWYREWYFFRQTLSQAERHTINNRGDWREAWGWPTDYLNPLHVNVRAYEVIQ